MQLHEIKLLHQIAEQGGCCVLNIQDMQAREVDNRTWELLGKLGSHGPGYKDHLPRAGAGGKRGGTIK